MVDIAACLEEAKKVFADFSEDELRDYVGQVQRLVKTQGLSYPRAIAEIADAQTENALQEARSVAESERKVTGMLEAIKKGTATLRSLMVRMSSKRQNLSNNVESASKSYQNKLASSLFDSLDEKTYHEFVKGDLDEAIAHAYDTGEGDAVAKTIAQAIKQFQKDSDYYLVRSGAYRLNDLHPKRFFKAIHDPARLLGKSNGLVKNVWNTVTRKTMPIEQAKARWKSIIKDNLDTEATFGKTDAVDAEGNIDEGEVERILDDKFDKIVRGDSDGILNNMVAPDLETLLKRKQMFFVWKDLRSFLNYAREYGDNSLYRSAMRDLHATSRRAGLCDIFGTAPQYAYNRVIKELPADDLKKQNRWYLSNDNIFKYVTGETSRVKHYTLAAIGANLRAFTGISANGSLLFSSLSDVNIAASFLSQTVDVPYFQAFLHSMNGIFKQYTDADAKHIAKMMHLSLHHEMGYIGRFVDANNLSNVTSKFSRLFYKGIGMQAKDDGHRVGVLTAMSRVMAMDKDKAFESLSPKRQKLLTELNIHREEWNLYRRHIKGRYWGLESLNDVSDDEIKTLRNKLYGRDTDVPLSQVRLDLYRKVHTFFDVGSDHAILNPGWYEQAFMAQGTQPGSVSGEAWRFFMQFKGFLSAYWNRVMYGGFANADGAQAKVIAAMQNFLYVVPLSYLSDYFYNLSQGKSMPPVSNAPVKDIIGWMAPGMGVLQRALDTDHENSDLIWALLKTPSMAAMGHLGSVPLRLLSGDPSGAVSEAGHAVSDFLPLSRAPVINPYVQALLGQQRYLEPNQQILYGPIPHTRGK